VARPVFLPVLWSGPFPFALTLLYDHTVWPQIMEVLRGNTEYRAKDPVSLRVRLLWQKPVDIAIPGDGEAGHGGGDRRLLDDIFIGGIDDPLHRAADHIQGAYSILTGVSAGHIILMLHDIECFNASILSLLQFETCLSEYRARGRHSGQYIVPHGSSLQG
jgi:hypothetical protein